MGLSFDQFEREIQSNSSLLSHVINLAVLEITSLTSLGRILGSILGRRADRQRDTESANFQISRLTFKIFIPDILQI